MKTKNFWKSLLMSAALLVSGAMVSCEKDQEGHPVDFDAQISASPELTTANLGETVTVTVVSNTDWVLEPTTHRLLIDDCDAYAGETGTTQVHIKIVPAGDERLEDDGWKPGDKIKLDFQAIGYVQGLKFTRHAYVEIRVGEPTVNDGTVNSPLSPEEANELCSTLGSGETTEQSYYIKGIVTSVKEAYTSQYGNGTFYIGSTANASETFYVYRAYYLNNKKFTDSDTNINVGDEVVVCGKLTNYNGTYETAQNSSYLYSLNGVTGEDGNSGEVTDPVHAGTADDPYTVADAINRAKITGETATEDAYYIKGLVKGITEQFSAQYGNATFAMVDEGSNNVFTAYRILYLNNEKWTDGDEVLHEGDEVIVCGNIVNYMGNTPETVQGSAYLYKIVSCTGYEEPTPDPVPDNVSFQSDAPFVCSADDSASASYTLGSSSTFNGKSATGFKLGTGSKSGKFTSAAVGVAGDCTLSLYAVAWKGQPGTLKVSIAGGGSIEGKDTYELKANNGATGNAPFTVTDLTQADCYTFSIKGLTANSTISFETVDGTYRAVVAGIHLTGGTATEPDPGTDPEPEPDDPGIETGKGSAQDPFSIAEAIAKAEQTGETETSEAYYIKGIVKSVGEQFSAQYGNATFAMVDEGSDKEFTAYRVLYLNNQKWVEGNDTIGVGDVVIVCGKIVNYKGNTPETAQNSGYLYQIVEKGTGKLPGEEESTDGKAVFNFANAGYENGQDIASATEGPITATFDGGGNNNTPKYYTTGSAIRLYAKNSVTFSGATITSIEFKFSSGEGTNEITADSGTYADGKWTGSATSVTFTVGGTSGHRRVASVVVEYK